MEATFQDAWLHHHAGLRRPHLAGNTITNLTEPNHGHDIVRVESEELPGVKVAIWLYAPFIMVSLLNLQYVIWAVCTGGRAWRHHTHAAFSRSFFLLLANIWLTDLVHGGLVLVANLHTSRAGSRDAVTPVLPYHHYGNTSAEVLPPAARWGLVLRLGVPLTVVTHALSNLAAVALTMSAESTLVASTACASCDVTLATSFRSRILGIIGGLWALDVVLVFYPLLTHMVHETLFQTVLYAWLAYIVVMAEVWIFVLCGLAYQRARRMHRNDPEYCPEEVLVSIRRKSLIIVPMTLVIYLTLLPWPVCEIIYTDQKLYRLIMPYLAPYLKGMDTRALYDYLCALPYVHFLVQSILVIAFRETRWRLCLGQRNAMMAEEKETPSSVTASPTHNHLENHNHLQDLELDTAGGGDLTLVSVKRGQNQQHRTSFIQGSLFAENIETLRPHVEPGGTLPRACLDDHLYYNTLPRETTV